MLYADAKETMQKINSKENAITPVLTNELVPLKQYNAVEKVIVLDMKQINFDKSKLIDIRYERYSSQKSQK